MDDFDRLARFLRKNRYWVKVKKHNSFLSELAEYRFADVRGKGIRAGFCDPGLHTTAYLDGRVAADNGKCFDKWSKCPLVIKIPTNQAEQEKLLEYFAYLVTEEGYQWSNKYGYLDEPRLPRETAYKDFEIHPGFPPEAST